MNSAQLEAAKKEWGFSFDITLKENRIYVANDGYITDNPIKPGKHTGEYKGFNYYSARRGTRNSLMNVIQTLSEMQEATA